MRGRQQTREHVQECCFCLEPWSCSDGASKLLTHTELLPVPLVLLLHQASTCLGHVARCWDGAGRGAGVWAAAPLPGLRVLQGPWDGNRARLGARAGVWLSCSSRGSSALCGGCRTRAVPALGTGHSARWQHFALPDPVLSHPHKTLTLLPSASPSCRAPWACRSLPHPPAPV